MGTIGARQMGYNIGMEDKTISRKHFSSLRAKRKNFNNEIFANYGPRQRPQTHPPDMGI